ncbi:oligosaccharide flippase family protein [Ramlibacter sp.]|uniref:oligosaccharide flippase family protein n=1 Tax=Ramlibacter sp. TaxID=1917967 RepID=UPI002D57E028|nr:oligosaccharide flippase family protein [Ramlibacter sp.]HYD77142.1 oligosaccharide flippase family protein [Ramlibacter sp.]
MTASALRSLAERAFKWSALTTAGRFMLQFVAQVLLARLLGPGNYGVYGIGLVVLTFAAFLSGNAFSYILMLQKDVNADDIRFAFTWQVIAGVVGSAAMYASAGWLASYFADPRIERMVHWLSAACLLMALAGPSTCLLQRDLNFRVLGLIQMGSYAAGYLVVGLPMALQGHGAQSLAAACVVQAAVVLAASFAARPHSVRPLLRHPLGGDTLDTGRTVFLTNIVNWLLANLDRIVIGRVLNTHAVGLYGVAYNIASIPNVLLVSAMQPTFLAAGARLQDEPRELAAAWRTVLACVLVMLTPLAVMMSLLAGDLVRVLYGTAWLDAGWVMAVMFLCVPAWAALGLSTPVLWNTGRKHMEAALQFPLLVLAVPAWWLLSQHGGLHAVVLASAVVIFARAGVVVATGMGALDVRWRELLPFALRGLALGVLAGAAVLAGRAAALPLGHPLLTLLGGAIAGALVLSVLVFIRPQVLGPEARGVVSRLLPGPRWAATGPEVHP